MAVKALIFDFDGLILDTELPDYLSWQEVYRGYGLELPLDLWLTYVGGGWETDFKPHQYLESRLKSKVDREQIWVSRRKSYLETLEGQPILPGVEAMLAAAQEAGLKLAVASSSPANWVLGHLTRLGLGEMFQAVVTADDVVETKPNPALFLLAAGKVGAAPNEAIVFEDSYNGVMAATRAGMFVVVVPNAVTAASDLSAADLRLDSLAEITLAELLAAAERKDD